MSEESRNLKVFSREAIFELASNNKDNCYISIHENVYDVTQFLDEHPGGEEALKEYQIKNNLFKDATESFEDVGHSMDARDMMKKYQIGVLEDKKEKKQPSKVTEATSKSSNGLNFSFLVVPALALTGLAIFYQLFMNRQ